MARTVRNERRYQAEVRQGDERGEEQRDRDRILYTSALRRLAGITQVVSPVEGHVFHNRLTHTLEVAQIGRRLAEGLIRKHGEGFVRTIGGVSPDVVEAAALAHDLGHPPFGHMAEEELRELLDTLKSNGKPRIKDGFEGNAQSFRIVTKLAVRYQRTEGIPGLNLTRATLDAMLKYPWIRDLQKDREDAGGKEKWGAYHSESDYLDWVRQAHATGDRNRSIEAQLMDWADDVAYAVHDLEDFYRAGLIPLDRLRKEEKERERFLEGAFRRLGKTEDGRRPLESAFSDFLIDWFPTEPYEGRHSQRAKLRQLTSTFINRYFNAVELDQETSGGNWRVKIDSGFKDEVVMLKELTWQYVILNPALATQQHGQRRVIRELFEVFMEAASSTKRWVMFPASYVEELGRIEREGQDKEAQRARLVVDFIASMTEQQALRMHQRITGASLGSVLDPTTL